MDDNLARLNRIYPNSGYVKIAKYDESQWKDREYDSKFDSKVSINRWKTNPLSYDEAQSAVSEGYRVGWIVPKGMCIIDIDNKDDKRSQQYIVRLLNKFEVKYSYNYTFHGMHILFQDSTQQIPSNAVNKCGLNLTVDSRANGTGYVVLPCNDPHRSWGDWNDYVEEVPYFLKPLLHDNTPTFIGMTDGDGRNNSLFKWRSQLERSHKLSAEEIEKCIRIINENLFETAMPNNELFKTVLKQRDKVKKQAQLDTENLLNKIADDIVSQYDIISFGDNFYKFNGSYYKPAKTMDIERLIHFEISKNLNSTCRQEILKFLRLKTQVDLEDFDKDWHKIATKGGILNLVNGDITLPTKADINTIFIPYEYSKNVEYSPRIDEFMKEITNGDNIKMQFLYQIAGYSLLKKNMFEKFFIFKGEGGTGKSTFMNLIHKMVGGDTNTSHVSLSDFDKDYYIASTLSKLLNIDDDVVDGKALENTGRFKSIISGNIISVRQIYQAVISFVPYVTCMFSCNRLPKIMDKTSGLYRRMVLIELNNKVLKPDPLFMNRVTDKDMEYFLFKAVEGIKIAIEEGRFKISQSETELLDLFKRRQSSLNEWIYENDLRIADLHDKKCMTLYNIFIQWCDENKYTKQMTAFTFKEEICAIYDLDIEFEKQEDRKTYQKFVKHGKFDPEYKPF